MEEVLPKTTTSAKVGVDPKVLLLVDKVKVAVQDKIKELDMEEECFPEDDPAVEEIDSERNSVAGTMAVVSQEIAFRHFTCLDWTQVKEWCLLLFFIMFSGG